MAVDSYGQPAFTDNDPVNLAVDMNLIADARKHSTRRVGTEAQRLATVAYEGLEWWQTDGIQGEWLYVASQWVLVRPLRTPVARFRMTGANFTQRTGLLWLLKNGGTWALDDPAGLVSAWGDAAVIARPGMYRLACEMAVGQSGVPTTGMTISWILPGGSSSDAGDRVALTAGVQTGGITRANSNPPDVRLLEGDIVGPRFTCDSAVTNGAQARRLTQFTLTWLGPPDGHTAW